MRRALIEVEKSKSKSTERRRPSLYSYYIHVGPVHRASCRAVIMNGHQGHGLFQRQQRGGRGQWDDGPQRGGHGNAHFYQENGPGPVQQSYQPAPARPQFGQQRGRDGNYHGPPRNFHPSEDAQAPGTGDSRPLRVETGRTSTPGRDNLQKVAEEAPWEPAYKRLKLDQSTYETRGQVGEGTYAKVYKAVMKGSSAVVAIKSLRMENERDGVGLVELDTHTCSSVLTRPDCRPVSIYGHQGGQVSHFFEARKHPSGAGGNVDPPDRQYVSRSFALDLAK